MTTPLLHPPTERYDVGDQRQLRDRLRQAFVALFPTAGAYIPVVTSSGGGETVTYTTQLGRWVRFGGLVWFSANLVLASKSGGSGDLQVSLPHSPESVMPTALSIWTDSMSATWTGAPVARITPSAGAALVAEYASGVITSAWSKLGSTGIIRLSGVYQAAA